MKASHETLFDFLENSMGGIDPNKLTPQTDDYERLIALMQAATTEEGTESGERDGSVSLTGGGELKVSTNMESEVGPDGWRRVGALALTRGNGQIGIVHEVWQGPNEEEPFALRYEGLPASAGWVWKYLTHLNHDEALGGRGLN